MLHLLLAVTLGAAPDDAADQFKKMEQQLLKCETFTTDVEIVGPGKDDKLKGRLLIARGNKVRMELDGSFLSKAAKLSAVSNGTKIRWAENDRPGRDQDTPNQLTEIFLASMSRTGIFLPLITAEKVENVEGKKPDPFDIDKVMAASDFKLGKKEMLAGVEAQVIDYKITLKAGKEPLTATVWIDPKTNLPVKRVVTAADGNKTFTITETYSKTAVNPKIDGKEFELPK